MAGSGQGGPGKGPTKEPSHREQPSPSPPRRHFYGAQNRRCGHCCSCGATMELRTGELNSPRLARLAPLRPAGMSLNANSHPTSSSQSAFLPTVSTCAA